jgi:glycosyltransferase involved in cell wall biosynthesis
MSVKVSIIVPTYKRAALLKRCVEALVSQDFPENEYEIIIVTDGLDEETNNMMTESAFFDFFSNIFCYSLPFKKGPAAARNAGWRIAKGQLILFTDDDCIPASNWIKNFYNAFEFYGQPSIALTGKVIVPLSPEPTDFELNTANLESAEFVTANCACTKSSLELVNGFDEAFTMAWREDSDLEFQLLKEEIPIKKIEEAVVVHPARKAAWGVSLKEQRKSMFNALLFKKHPQLYKEKISSPTLRTYYLMILFLITFFYEWYQQNKIIAFISLFAWAFLMISFIVKRLTNASRSFKHVSEMVATSLLIPFVSVFWNLYGAIKFKVLHV